MDSYEYSQVSDRILILKENHDTAYKININAYIILEVSNDNVVCGLEINNASQVLHLTRNEIKQSTVECSVENNDDTVQLILTFYIHNKIRKQLKICREFNTTLVGTEFILK